MEYVFFSSSIFKALVDAIRSRALYTDSCLFVVPGSHKVPRTVAQRALSSGQIPDNPLDMPDSLQVILQRKPPENL